jgi:hypothetical protein
MLVSADSVGPFVDHRLGEDGRGEANHQEWQGSVNRTHRVASEKAAIGRKVSV